MNNLTTIMNSTVLTMSSVEIAELTGKRHDNVMRIANKLANAGIITSPQIEEMFSIGNNAKNWRKIFRLNKVESLNLVASLSPEFTAKIIDRWLELEESNVRVFEIPDNLPDALRLAADESERADVAEQALLEAQPKVDGFNYFLDSDSHGMNLTRAMKAVDQKPVIAIRALRKTNILYGTPATPTAYYKDKGYFKMVPVEDRNQPGIIRPQTFVTPKGLDWLRRRLPSIIEAA